MKAYLLGHEGYCCGVYRLVGTEVTHSYLRGLELQKLSSFNSQNKAWFINREDPLPVNKEHYNLFDSVRVYNTEPFTEELKPRKDSYSVYYCKKDRFLELPKQPLCLHALGALQIIKIKDRAIEYSLGEGIIRKWELPSTGDVLTKETLPKQFYCILSLQSQKRAAEILVALGVRFTRTWVNTTGSQLILGEYDEKKTS